MSRGFGQQLEYYLLRVQVARMKVLMGLVLEERDMALNMPKLKAAAVELQKLIDTTEAGAGKIINDISAAHTHRDATFARAPAKVAEIRQGVAEFGKFLDTLDQVVAGSNGDPTSDVSDVSHEKVVDVSDEHGPEYKAVMTAATGLASGRS